MRFLRRGVAQDIPFYMLKKTAYFSVMLAVGVAFEIGC